MLPPSDPSNSNSFTHTQLSGEKFMILQFGGDILKLQKKTELSVLFSPTLGLYFYLLKKIISQAIALVPSDRILLLSKRCLQLLLWSMWLICKTFWIKFINIVTFLKCRFGLCFYRLPRIQNNKPYIENHKKFLLF